MSAFVFETQRLILREFDIRDAQSFYDLNKDIEVIKYTGDKAFESLASAKSFLEAYDHFQLHGFGRWAVVRKADEKFIGWCGLKLNEEEYIDIGFRFFRNEWNKGYATESAIATLNYGFNILNLPEIIGRVAKDNTASVSVLEKLGLTFWKKGLCHGLEDSLYYRITKSEFNNIFNN